MGRTTISITDELLQRLRVIAAERRTSIAALVREALEEKVEGYRPRPKSLGVGASGHRDTARRTAYERATPRGWHLFWTGVPFMRPSIGVMLTTLPIESSSS